MDNQPSSVHAPAHGHEEIISYQKLRAFIGITGILLPVAVVMGCWIFGAGKYSWQPSISHYYYSKMHIVFILILCVLGAFLITYKGKDVWESRLSNLAGYCAFGIASLPTKFKGFLPAVFEGNQYLQLFTEVTNFWGGVHFGFAGALFACFVIFCLHFFQKPDEDYVGEALKKFKRRQRIYKICGWAIVVSIAMIGLLSFVIKPPEVGLFIYSTFIFETTSMWAFGVAWLIKGSAVLKRTPMLKTMIQSLR